MMVRAVGGAERANLLVNRGHFFCQTKSFIANFQEFLGKMELSKKPHTLTKIRTSLKIKINKSEIFLSEKLYFGYLIEMQYDDEYVNSDKLNYYQVS